MLAEGGARRVDALSRGFPPAWDRSAPDDLPTALLRVADPAEEAVGGDLGDPLTTVAALASGAR